MLDSTQVGESYDMIIGVDGTRVMNFLDFQDRMTDLQPGEVIYQASYATANASK